MVINNVLGVLSYLGFNYTMPLFSSNKSVGAEIHFHWETNGDATKSGYEPHTLTF